MPRDSEVHRFFHKKESADDYLAIRVEQLRAEIREKEARRLSVDIGASYHELKSDLVELRLAMWGREIRLMYPDLVAVDAASGEPLDTFNQAMLAYYCRVSDGTPQHHRWIAFSELPDGKFYTQAFQGYTGKEISKAFGDDVARFSAAAEKLGGVPQVLGDRAFSFQALPYVSLMVVCWLGDEDFLTSYRILFDASVSHHLTTDGCAIVGSTLTRRLIKAGARE